MIALNCGPNVHIGIKNSKKTMNRLKHMSDMTLTFVMFTSKSDMK
jgi:hypothetical protein